MADIKAVRKCALVAQDGLKACFLAQNQRRLAEPPPKSRCGRCAVSMSVVSSPSRAPCACMDPSEAWHVPLDGVQMRANEGAAPCIDEKQTGLQSRSGSGLCLSNALLASSWELQRGGGWRHGPTGDTWHGELWQGMPSGKGRYVFADTGLRVHGLISGTRHDSLVFSGQGAMEWPDGSSYDGELEASAFSGSGKFRWSNGDEYDGQWQASKRHGKGIFLRVCKESSELELAALGPGERAHCSRYEGDWMDDQMHGHGKVEYHLDSSWQDFLKEPSPEQERKVIRRFVGTFKKGFPTTGCLETEKEKIDWVVFDGSTNAGGFAVWYWKGSPDGESRGSRLVDLDHDCEEYNAVLAQFRKSMPPLSIKISSVQRVQNDEMRMIFDLQRRALEKKVEAPPRSRPWNPRTMERWAFHAPGAGSKVWSQQRPGAGGPGQQATMPNGDAGAGYLTACPWESIVEEGFQATLAGSENGKAYGSGIYFARDAVYSDRYAQKTAALLQDAAAKSINGSGQTGEGKLCRIFLTRIVTGIYTAGSPGMSQPPLDPNGAKGEHFHCLVDNVHNPGLFVIPDNTRAYPAYLVSYERAKHVYSGCSHGAALIQARVAHPQSTFSQPTHALNPANVSSAVSTQPPRYAPQGGTFMVMPQNAGLARAATGPPARTKTTTTKRKKSSDVGAKSKSCKRSRSQSENTDNDSQPLRTQQQVNEGHIAAAAGIPVIVPASGGNAHHKDDSRSAPDPAVRPTSPRSASAQSGVAATRPTAESDVIVID